MQNDREKPVKKQIDEHLRKVYQVTLEEEVPERFHELLRRLRDQGASE